MKSSHTLLIFSLFVLALITKTLFFLTHVPFSQDQVRDVVLIHQHLANQNFFIPFGPSTSVGNFFLPPLYYYLHALASLVFFQRFFAMDALVILVESLTPIVIYFLTWKITGKRFISWSAGLIYLFASGVIGASTAWNPNLVPFFSTSFIFCWLVYFLEKSKLALVGAVVAFAALIQFHFQWFVLLPFSIILIVHAFTQLRTTWKPLLISLTLAFVLISPYLFQEVSIKFENTLSAVTLLDSNTAVYERVRKPVYATLFFPNFYQRMMFGNMFVQSWDKQYEVFQTPMIVGSGIFLVLMAITSFSAWENIRKQRNPYLALYLLVFISSAIFLRFYKGDKPDYYIYIFLSFFPIFIAVTLEKLSRNYFWGAVLAVVGIVSTEILATTRIPWHNDFQSYERITTKIAEVAQDHQVFVEPVNQELVIPLQYFIDEDLTNPDKKIEAEYYVLFCYTNQKCDQFTANSNSEENKFAYNHIDLKDFSFFWKEKRESPERSFTLTEGNFTARFVSLEESEAR